MSDDQGQAWLKVHEHRADELAWSFYVLAAVAAVAILAPMKWPKSATALTILTLLLSFGRSWHRWLHRPRRRENSAPRISQRSRRHRSRSSRTKTNDVRVDIITLFPEICRVPLGESMMGRAQEAGALDLRIHNLRDWTSDRHHVVDDAPFGGGQGMVMKPEPIFAAVESLRTGASTVVLMTPQGRRFAQSMAQEFSAKGHLIIVCGHYEGIDHRVIEHLVDAEISIGDYVLTNGAIAAVVFVDAIVRLIPGVLGDEQSAVDDSFSRGLLEAPQYTRPAEFRGWKVPDILLSGHHAEIAAWRRRRSRAPHARKPARPAPVVQRFPRRFSGSMGITLARSPL